MKKADLVNQIAESTNLSKVNVKRVIDAAIKHIMEAVSNGEKVSFVGFGTFGVSNRAQRTGRNPRTGEKITIKSSKLPKFKCGRIFKEMVNK
ncbi:MAG: HU family DNA-binding protein [Deltaproteobacteria bacterium]|nr:HU family DNA-binding protein [Deltaproteobacteria bacterium]